MPIIELPRSGLSKGLAMRSKNWIKRLDSVDRSKDDGFAFVGDFKNWAETVEVPNGTWFLGFAEDRSGSGHLRDRTVTLWQVRDGGLVEVEGWTLDNRAGWALKVRDEIADLLAGATVDDPDWTDIDEALANLRAALEANDAHRYEDAVDAFRVLDEGLRSGDKLPEPWRR